MKNILKNPLTPLYGRDTVESVMVRGYTADQVREMLRAQQGDRSQADLAREIGITRSYLGDVLTGRTVPGPAIQSFLGLVPGYIKSERAA